MGVIGNMQVTASTAPYTSSAEGWNNLNVPSPAPARAPQYNPVIQKGPQVQTFAQQQATKQANANAMQQTQQNTLNQVEMQNKIRAARLGGGAVTPAPNQAPQQGMSNQLMQLLQQMSNGTTQQPRAGTSVGYNNNSQNTNPQAGGTNFVAPQISVAPIWNQAQVGNAQAGLRNTPIPQMAPNGAAAGAQGGLNQMMRDAVSGAGSANAINFGRDAAFRNAGQVRSANQANVGRGLDAANLAASQYTGQLGYNNAQQNLIMSLLGSFL